MIYGYARVSTTGQTLDAQKEALKAAGAEKIFAETESGAKTDRAQLAKIMATLAPRDIVLITCLDQPVRDDPASRWPEINGPKGLPIICRRALRKTHIVKMVRSGDLDGIRRLSQDVAG